MELILLLLLAGSSAIVASLVLDYAKRAFAGFSYGRSISNGIAALAFVAVFSFGSMTVATIVPDFSVASIVLVYAQSLDIQLDLSEFWNGFNQFFNALFPPLAFIASIGAALGFIFLIVNSLKTAFGGRG